MDKTNYGLTKWAKEWLGRPYWYGCVCYECTEELLRRKAAQYPSHYGSARMARYKSDIKRDMWCADCIGLAKGYVWWDEELRRAKYASNGCPDKSADGMKEAARRKGKIGTLPETPGLMLWKPGHVGIYMGDGWLIEARGFDYGIVRTRVSDRGFDMWFELPGLEYLSEAPGEEELPARPGDIRITGDAVNIRRGPGTTYPIAGVARRGEAFESAANPGGWRQILREGEVCWVSPKYSEVVK